MQLHKVNPDNKIQIKFLFDMLKERTIQQSISFKMPTFEEHCKFVKNNPYEVWYIIINNDEMIGNVYLTKNNEWGYFIKKDKIGKGLGTEALRKMTKLHPRDYYYSNINPTNHIAIQLAKVKFGGKLIQLTYKIPRGNI